MSLVKKMFLALVTFLLVILAGLYQVGVFAVFFPSHQHEIDPPVLPVMSSAQTILLFTKTNSFRHEEGIEAGSKLINSLAEKNAWQIVQTENGAVFNSRDLAKFKAVIFLNTSGDTLSASQQKAFQSWLLQGGGWLGVHAAGDGSHQDWPWYMENLIGVVFTGHTMGPQFQQATVINEHLSHPVMVGLSGNWAHTEEWYSWQQSPRAKGFEVLASVDESSYQPHLKLIGKPVYLRMGDHPIVWANCLQKGRAVYSAMGHAAEAYRAPEHQTLIENAIRWLLVAQEEGCEPLAI